MTTPVTPSGGAELSDAAASRHMVIGSLWLIALRVAVRSLGTISVIILARLLVPQDFAIVAMAQLFMLFVDSLSRTGVQITLLRHANPDKRHYDAGWTLNLLISVGFGLLITLCAPWIAQMFGEPRSEAVIAVIGLCVAVLGFENIGVVNFRRHFKFNKEFKLHVGAKLVMLLVSIPCAIIYQSYWAMVAGIAASQVARVAGSYMVESYRPRFSVSALREILHFSVWSYVSAVGTFFLSTIDRWIIAIVMPTVALGFFTVAIQLAKTLIEQPMGAISRSTVSVFARLTHDPDRLVAHFNHVMLVRGYVVASVGVGLALIAEDTVAILFGTGWETAGALMRWLTLAVALGTLTSSAVAVIRIMGRVILSNALIWGQLVVTGAIIYWAAAGSGVVETVAIAKAGAAAFALPASWLALRVCMPLRLVGLLAVLSRPLLASVAMIAVVLGLQSSIQFTPLLAVAVQVPAGAVAFMATALTAWCLAGRPPGPEAGFVRYAGRLCRRLVAKPAVSETDVRA